MNDIKFEAMNYQSLINHNSFSLNFNQTSNPISTFASNRHASQFTNSTFSQPSMELILENNCENNSNEFIKQRIDSYESQTIGSNHLRHLTNFDEAEQTLQNDFNKQIEEINRFNAKVGSRPKELCLQRSKKFDSKVLKNFRCIDDDNLKRARANFQERKRMRRLNVALKELRNKIPFEFHRHPPEKNLSKIKTLQHATAYIRALTNYLSDRSCLISK